MGKRDTDDTAAPWARYLGPEAAERPAGAPAAPVYIQSRAGPTWALCGDLRRSELLSGQGTPGLAVCELRALWHCRGGRELPADLLRAIADVKLVLGGTVESARALQPS